MSDEAVKQLLVWIVTSGAGVVVTNVVNWLVKISDPMHPLSPRARFYFSLVLAFAVPNLAYLTAVQLGYLPFTVGYVLTAFGTGYVVSQTIHFEATHPGTEGGTPHGE
jgi:uncharacterized membrane protein